MNNEIYIFQKILKIYKIDLMLYIIVLNRIINGFD